MELINHLDSELDELVYFICDRLAIKPSRLELDVCELDGTNGLCIDLDESSFLILVKPTETHRLTLAHELIHVKQYIHDNLGWQLDNSTSVYETAWWEVEAREGAKLLLSEWYEHRIWEYRECKQTRC